MLSYIVLPSSLVVTFDGQPHTINSADARYQVILDAITEGRFDDVPELVNVEKAYENSGLVYKDNQLWLDGEVLEGVLADRIIQFQADRIPFEPLIKFVRKLRKNPSFNSRQQLYKFLEHNGHPITSEGNFIAYRGVRGDMKDCHTGEWDNSVGKVCQMDRHLVDDNPNNTCSNGLHVACYEYAKGFGAVTVEVEVDPVDVVCVPTDYNRTKMRVCRFKVVQVCKQLNNRTMVDSSYEPDWELPSIGEEYV